MLNFCNHFSQCTSEELTRRCGGINHANGQKIWAT